MATRMYFESVSPSAGGTPAVDVEWDDTNEFNRYALTTSKDSSTLTEITVGTGGTYAAGDAGIAGQFISQDVLPAGEISGTVTCVIRSREASTANDMFPCIGIRVVSGDGTTVRGTLLSVGDQGSTEFSVTSTNRYFANAVSLSPVTAAAGDRIVVEIGGTTPAGKVVPRCYMDVGSASGTDLVANETGTSNDDPWIEFSADLFAGGDTTAPTLSSPSASATGATTGAGSVSTDEGNGTLYWVVTTSATAPSVAQVQAGQDHTGNAAVDSGSQAVSGTGSQSISGGFTGLTESTTYYVHYQHQDASTNDSTVASSASFTTSASGSAIPAITGQGSPFIMNPSEGSPFIIG